jgi:DNA primase large subunit
MFLVCIKVDYTQASLAWEVVGKTFGCETKVAQLAYNVRYKYGLEGKRISYSAYSCGKLQSTEHNICPFSNEDQRAVTDKFSHSVPDIEDLLRGGHYNAACHKHTGSVSKVATHSLRFKSPVELYQWKARQSTM